jgi:FkbH-like protein
MNWENPSELPWLLPSPGDFSAQCRSAVEDAGNAAMKLRGLANFNATTRDSMAFGRSMKKLIAADDFGGVFSHFRLGIISHANFDLMADPLVLAAARHSVALTVIGTNFGQIEQEAFTPCSTINSASADAILLALDHRWLGLEERVPLQEPAEVVQDALERIGAIVQALRQNGGAPTILQTIPHPPTTLFGNYDRRVAGTLGSVIDKINLGILKLSEEQGAYILDIGALVNEIGSSTWFDRKQWAAYKLPFYANHVPIYADRLGRLLGAIRGKNRKVLVLDLDNTIWGGVIGDDGVDGIALGQGTAKGETYLEVQSNALALRRRGIVLAVCSKNTEEVARAAFREHPEMLLKESDIAVFQANWTDKVSNLKVIAETLNLGLDSLVFLDDNPAERGHVRQDLPMVAVPELPEDPTAYPWLMLAPGYFEAVSFSGDDRTRADSYKANAERVKIRGAAKSIDDYLASLDMKIKLEPFTSAGRGRITQLINKTNQFNLTTRRYTEAEVQRMEEGGVPFTLQVRLQDKFSDLGMISVLVCRDGETSGTWDIDTFLMSCRVLGRRVEECILGHLVEAAKLNGISKLRGNYLPTSKNGLVKDLFTNLGFAEIRTSETLVIYELDVMSYSPDSTRPPVPFSRGK